MYFLLMKFVLLFFSVGLMKIRDVFPVWAIVAIIGTILCFAMLILTEYHSKPRYHSVINHLFSTNKRYSLYTEIGVYSMSQKMLSCVFTLESELMR